MDEKCDFDTLKDCPFCGGETELIFEDSHDYEQEIVIYCVECIVRMSCFYMGEADDADTSEIINYWNQRVVNEEG